ncbi:hypothetical protein ACTI_33450 [Actinoplanes sp. OR16]|nr:hypothetical protein ACTI_33450 [Actinoplanes sp. OR16]
MPAEEKTTPRGWAASRSPSAGIRSAGLSPFAGSHSRNIRYITSGAIRCDATTSAIPNLPQTSRPSCPTARPGWGLTFGENRTADK